MVTEIINGNKTFFKCDECSFTYDDKGLAQTCEDWCIKHQSCNLEITRKAVILDDAKPVL